MNFVMYTELAIP